jgi:hypothetical protein
MDDVKKAYAWQEAIKLSQQLVAVCEEFSDPEANVLVWHLRQAVVDIPAGIAANLQAGDKATMDSMVKLDTTLELVRRVYPGIETGEAEERFEQLWQRMSGKDFSEREPEPEEEEVEEAAAEEVMPVADAEEPKPEKDKTATPEVDGVSQSTAVEVAVTPPDDDAAKDPE